MDSMDETQRIVEDFINERTQYVSVAQELSGPIDADYFRWQGHMEARRQLAESLGWTVPHELHERTQKKNPGN